MPSRREQQRDSTRRAQALRRLAVDAIKSAPCADCGNTYPAVCMDFDHRDPATKTKAVSQLISECRSMDIILEEIAKCDLVCANCHRIRTWARKRNPYMLTGLSERESSQEK